MSASLTAARIAVLIPCLNEEVTISKVVQDFLQGIARSYHLRLRQQ